MFAQQFESSGPERFGLIAVTPRTLPVAVPVERDRVEPLVLLARQKNGGEDEKPGRADVERGESALRSGHERMDEGFPLSSQPSCVCSILLNIPYIEQHGSTSAVAWDRFLFHSSLVSGQGLLSVGASSKTAQQEVEQIQEENARKLSALSEEEILQEQERIKRILSRWITRVERTTVSICCALQVLTWLLSFKGRSTLLLRVVCI